MEITDFGFSKHVEMIMLCLMALGHQFQCEMPDCVFENPEFSLDSRSRWPTVDHIDPTNNGGSNHPKNLRFAHRRCNCGAPTRGKTIPERSLRRHTAETRAKISANRRAYWDNSSPEQLASHRQRIAAAPRPIRECECGMISFAASMGRHLKSSGHKLVVKENI